LAQAFRLAHIKSLAKIEIASLQLQKERVVLHRGDEH